MFTPLFSTNFVKPIKFNWRRDENNSLSIHLSNRYIKFLILWFLYNNCFLSLQIKLQEEKKLEGFVAIPEGENEDTRKALLKNLFWQLDSKNITEGFKKIQKEICELGYTSGNLKVQ